MTRRCWTRSSPFVDRARTADAAGAPLAQAWAQAAATAAEAAAQATAGL